MTKPEITSSSSHLAYSDESNYNTGRYRSLALVTLRETDYESFSDEIREMLKISEVFEFKWKELAGAKQRFASLRLIDFTLAKAFDNLIRVDVLIWDTEDSRHKLRGRDDIANLHRMYYHLLRNVLKKRWPDDAVWKLCPDENTAMRWNSLKDYLDYSSLEASVQEDPGDDGFIINFKEYFRITEIAPCKSHEEPLAQLSDLFAGIAIFSRNDYQQYKKWVNLNKPQLSFFETEADKLSKSQIERYPVLKHLDDGCKKMKLGVSLNTFQGLTTLDPKNPINFWFYEPQTELDKAPVKERSS